MSRMIVRYQDNGLLRWGELFGPAPQAAGDPVRLVALALQCATTAEFLAQAPGLGATDEGHALTLQAAALVSPVTSDAALICQGLNYATHAQETQQAERKSNLIFGKAGSSITGPYDDIVRPAEVQLLDYEVEFALVMRRAVGAQDRINPENIGEYVAGIVLCNDVSARDIQFGESLLQWFRGKSYRTFCPVGPVLWLLDPAEVAPALERLEIRLHVNGELRQQANSQQLIWNPVETLNFVGTILDMRAGDLLLTGTPGGVTTPITPRMVEIIQKHLLHDDIRRDELCAEMTKGRPFLRPGDVVAATLIESGSGRVLGGLRNTIAGAVPHDSSPPSQGGPERRRE